MVVGRLLGRLGPQHLLALARQLGGRGEFLVAGDERLTRRQVFARVDALAGGLQSLGVHRGDHVATLLPACPEAVYALFLPWVLGTVEVALDPHLGGAALRRILAGCRAKVVLTTRDWRGRDLAAAVAAMRPDLASLRYVIAASPGGDDHNAAYSIEGLIAAAAPLWRAHVSLKEPGRIAYSARWHGRPLGVVHSRGAYWQLVQAGVRARLDAAALGCVLLPFSPHQYAGWLGIMAALLAGGKVVLMERFEPQQVLETIERERVTQLCATPAMVRRLLLAPGQPGYDLSSLRGATLAGGPCPPGLASALRARLRCSLECMYGTAESGLISWTAPEDPWQRVATTVGRPAPGVEVRIVDERRQPVPAGKQGEVAVRSRQMMLGYHDDGDATADVLDAAGWFYTGDLGLVDGDGYLRLVGRKQSA